jgi:multidrug efflux pump
MGGDNVIFWGPLAWTVIYGLFIATFLTLIVVPILFFLSMKLKMWVRTKFNKEAVVTEHQIQTKPFMDS